MNLSLTTDDALVNILENYKLWCGSLGIDTRQLVMLHQTHSNEVIRVDEKNCGEGLYKPRQLGVDGMVTKAKGVALITSHADCAPIYVYDPVNEVIGLSHAGWRGTTLEIARRTVEKMKDEFDSNPADLHAAIGPCISIKHFECGEDVISAISDMSVKDIPGAYTYNPDQGKFYVSLPIINKAVLMSAGIPESQIEIDGRCTFAERERYFSHRRDGLKRGGQMAVLMLK
ncbi:peptidoglycan editing factor PgeF [Mogibacterium neglectum]|nr:peptidoglycan editing factor PgeF [Mogibacterium neglectum]